MVIVEVDVADFWSEVVRRTYNGGHASSNPLVIWKPEYSDGSVPHPSEAHGVLVRNVGELKGQIADWRGSLDDTEQGFHAVEFADRYECHMDAQDPFKNPVGHLVEDSPGTLVLVGAVATVGVATAILYALSKKR